MANPVFAEYADPDALIRAIRTLREQGYSRLDAHTPYPIEDVRRALGKRRSRLPVMIFVVGMLAAGGAYALQWYLVAYLYPLDVGGRPPHMPLAFVIITFEMGILFSAFAAFFGVLYKARLLRLWDPVFELEGFGDTSIDRHWVRVSESDPEFSTDGTTELLASTGALRVLQERGEP